MNKFSIIIPVFNEELNISNLISNICDSLKDKFIYEIIVINDGSTDKTLNILYDIKLKNLKILNLSKNSGQSYAIFKGIENARFDTCITIDGDGQNDPNDIPKLINIFFNSNDFSLVGGIRKRRKDKFSKIISSKFANYIRKIILNDNCDDTGCSLKVFKKKYFLKIPYFDGLHRYLPALFKFQKQKTHFINVNHFPRVYGVSKYNNINSALKGLRDIIKVLKIKNTFKNELP
jgi:dolichol-phosphate mannosyltransferase